MAKCSICNRRWWFSSKVKCTCKADQLKQRSTYKVRDGFRYWTNEDKTKPVAPNTSHNSDLTFGNHSHQSVSSYECSSSSSDSSSSCDSGSSSSSSD